MTNELGNTSALRERDNAEMVRQQQLVAQRGAEQRAYIDAQVAARTPTIASAPAAPAAAPPTVAAPAVAPVTPAAPATMPDGSDPAAIEAARRAAAAAQQRNGRSSTILTAPADRTTGRNSRRTADYAGRTLG